MAKIKSKGPELDFKSKKCRKMNLKKALDVTKISCCFDVDNPFEEKPLKPRG